MIDLRRLRDDQDYAKGVVNKGVSHDLIDELLTIDQKHRTLLAYVEELRAKSNAASKAIGKAAPEARQAMIAGAKELSDTLAESEKDLAAVEVSLSDLALTVPNPAHDSVPVGGEDDFRVERTVGDLSAPPTKDHAELGEALGLVDTERAVRMSGSRFAYVLGDAVRLQFGLIQFAMTKLARHGFVPAVVPVLVREEMMVDAGFFPTDRNQVYELEKDELFLVGTSEVGLAGLHRSERLNAEELPVRYVGYSSCFRREAGTYGKDTRGLFRVHQFDKVEMFIYAHPDHSWDELELLRELEEEIFTELELPYRVITVASGDLGAAAAKKYDLEVWLPSEQRYRELTSCSNYTDFSSRRMGTRTKTGGGTQPLHTLNGTAVAIGRTLLALFENHQLDTGDGFRVPAALQPYCGGLEVVTAR